jgi:hypothetical protein
MIADMLRFYSGYTADAVADQLDRVQLLGFLEEAGQRPFDYFVQVDPKKMRRH